GLERAGLPRAATGSRSLRWSSPRSCDGGGDLFLVSARVLDALPGHAPATLYPLGDEGRAALRARVGHGPRPDGERARRVVGAGEERLATAAAPLGELAAAVRLRADDAERD